MTHCRDEVTQCQALGDPAPGLKRPSGSQQQVREWVGEGVAEGRAHRIAGCDEPNAWPGEDFLSGLTPELSRAAKRLRLE